MTDQMLELPRSAHQIAAVVQSLSQRQVDDLIAKLRRERKRSTSADEPA